MIKKFTAAAVLVLALTIGATSCSGADVPKSKFQSELEKKTQLTKTQSKCAVDKMYSELSQKEINKLYTADTEKDVSATVQAKFTEILKDCVTS